MSDKDATKVYKEGAAQLPTNFTGETEDFRLFINNILSCAKECKWDTSILTFTLGTKTLNLIQDYGRIPMATIIASCDACNTATPLTHADARPSIDSSMMFKCLKNSLGDKFCSH